MKQIFTCLVGFFISAVVYSQAGSFDASFGNGGRVFTNLNGPSGDYARSMAVQPDGKIILGGYSFIGTYGSFALCRYNLDGSADATFGNNGRLVTDIGTYTIVNAIAIQNDGKILAAGYQVLGTTNVCAVYRYNANGSLDTGFDIDGMLTIPFQLSGEANGLAIQPDGKIVVAGTSYNGNTEEFALARLNTNGSPDFSFGNSGKVIAHVGSSNVSAWTRAVVLQNDGKIVIAGGSGFGNISKDFTLARFNSNGTPDGSFNGSGIVVTDIALMDDFANAVAIQTDGKLLAAGYNFNGSNYDYALVRYTINGTLDPAYDGDGKVITAIGLSDDIATGIAIQNDGKAVVAGYTNNYNRNDGITSVQNFSLVRYTTNGSPDITFGNGGKVTSQVASGQSTGNAISLYLNRIYVGGHASAPGSAFAEDFAIAAYLNDALPLPLFLVDFSAVSMNSSVACTWQTTGEVNEDRFIVQRSSNGNQFEDIGTVNAGNSTSIATYIFTDKLSAEMQGLSGIYYRLQIVDKDGRSAYSAVIFVKMEQNRKAFTIYPNPAHTFVQLAGRDLLRAQVLDIDGKVLLSKERRALPNNRLNIANLPKGLYLVKVVTLDNKEQVQKLVVQ